MATDRLAISNLVERFAPTRGLFSSTLAQSPNVQSIVVAQIRHRTLFDVVFVHRYHIVVRQFDEAIAGAGPLKHVATKADFDSLITSAKALGPVEFDWESVDLSAYAQHRDLRSPKSSSFFDRASPVSENDDTRQIISELQDRSNLPPQVLVLTLRRGRRDTLALLFGYHDSARKLQFIHHQRPLPAQISTENNREALRLGAHLAIEPEGRAMVVAALEGRFMLYKLKSRKDWFQDQDGVELEHEDTFQPIAEEKQIRVSGTIHKIDFLRSQDGDPHNVIIVLLTGLGQQQTLLQRWDWDTRLPLSDTNAVRQVWTGHPINPQFFQAHLLIPSITECGFVLVTHGLMCRFSEIYGPGVPKTREIRLPINKDPSTTDEYQRNLGDRPCWTAWAHPAGRTSSHHRRYNNFYLCREDGAIRFIESERGSDIVVHNELELNTANDTAFTVIALTSNHNSEFVITANGFFTLRPREDFERQQIFDDWSTINDFSLTNGGDHVSIATCSPKSFDKLNILHTAIEARVIVPIQGAIEDAEQRWILPAGSKSSVSLVCSSTIETRCELVSTSSKEQLSGLRQVLEEHLDLESRSLYVGTTNSGIVVQATPSSVRAWSRKGDLQILDIQGTARTAALELSTGQLVLFTKDAQSSYLQLCYVGFSGDSLVLQSKPLGNVNVLRLEDNVDAVTSMSTKSGKDGSLLVVVSTWDSGLLFVHLNEKGDVKDRQTLPCDVQCESISIRQREPGFLITLGLRNGVVRFLQYDSTHNKVTDDTETSLGSGPVSVLALQDGALAACDGNIIKLQRGIRKGQVFQRRVTLSPAQDVKIIGLSAGPSWFSTANETTVAVLTSSGTLVVSLSAPSILCRKVNIFGEGNNDYKWRCQITHSLPYGERLIVVYKYTSITEKASGPGSNGTLGSREVYYKLTVINPRATKKHRPSEDRILRDGGKKDKSFTSGEEVQDIFEWNAVVSGSKYKLIVVRTKRPPKTDKKPGRLYVYTVTPDENLFLRSTVKRAGPINAARQYNANSLILYWGSTLEVSVLERKEGGGLVWTTGSFSRQNLPGPGPALAVGCSSSSNQLVHLTSKEQVTVFEDRNERRWESGDRHNITQMHLM